MVSREDGRAVDELEDALGDIDEPGPERRAS